jgi:hypothetical protein
MTTRVPQPQGSPLFPAVTDSKNLLAAWEKVEENAGTPGIDGISVDVSGLTLGEELARRRKALRTTSHNLSGSAALFLSSPLTGED